jgi:hypothetical protein
MEPRAKKVGIMLSAPPASPEFPKALSAAEQAITDGSQVYLYCIDSGVEGLAHAAFARLKQHGAKLFACAYSLQQRGLAPAAGATLSGLTVLSDILASTDEFHSFN